MPRIRDGEDRPAKRARLLSDESSSDESDAEPLLDEHDQSNGGRIDSLNGLKINEEYAKRFEHNKKREELHKLEEKYGKSEGGFRPKDSTRGGADSKADVHGLDSDSDSESQSEDDEGILVTQKLDAEIMSTLKAIQSKDPRVYDKESKFYTEEELMLDPTGSNKSKEKPIFLQDYHRQNLLNGGPELDGAEATPTYAEEQNALKRQLVEQMHTLPDEDDDDDVEAESDEETFLTRKTETKPERRPPKISEADVQAADKDPETFLSNFMAARAWVPTSNTKLQPFESDDDDEDNKADAFEEAFNMRFEDPEKANMKLMSHSREAAAKYSVRREEPKGRRKAREVEQARKLDAKAERDAEMARLRNLKIEEAQEKLRKFKEAAGLRGQIVPVEQWSKFLEAGWDSDKWDQEMTRQFGDDYYAAQEDGESDGEEQSSSKRKKKVKKPKFDDDIDICDIVPEFNNEDLQDARRFTLSDDENGEADGVSLGDDRATNASKKDKAQLRYEQKRQARKDRQKLEQLVDQSLAMDSALPAASAQGSAFRYRETSPSAFGLSAQEILMAEDAQLNQYVGLKKLAPFRDEEKKRRDKKKLGKKARLRQWRKETFGDAEGPLVQFQEHLASKLHGGDDVANSGAEEAAGNAASRKKRKRSRKGKAHSAAKTAAAT